MTDVPAPDSPASLKRGLGLWLTTFYGLGVVVGAGIYVLIGALAGVAGTSAPFSFLLAAAVVGVTALSYMELCARLPEAAGEAAYVDQGFSLPVLTLLVGLGLVMSGMLTAATVTLGAAGYLRTLVEFEPSVLIVVILAGLSIMAIWGIVESAALAAILTLVEVGGLLFVAGGAVVADPAILTRVGEVVPDWSWASWSGIVSGTIIAFFAFVGFEDMVNVAEEVKTPERTMPKAIGLVLVLSTLLYLIVATVCVLAVPVAELAASPAPLALVAGRALPGAGVPITFVAIAAALNGILVQLIMAPRVLYGLARRGRLPAWFARVSSRTRTPVNATVFVAVAATLLAVALPIVDLASMSARLVLAIFVAVNLALVRIKWRDGPVPAVRVPLAVPILGAALSAALLITSILV